jgi:hypothetical protein
MPFGSRTFVPIKQYGSNKQSIYQLFYKEDLIHGESMTHNSSCLVGGLGLAASNTTIGRFDVFGPETFCKGKSCSNVYGMTVDNRLAILDRPAINAIS